MVTRMGVIQRVNTQLDVSYLKREIKGEKSRIKIEMKTKSYGCIITIHPQAISIGGLDPD